MFSAKMRGRNGQKQINSQGQKGRCKHTNASTPLAHLSTRSKLKAAAPP